MKLIMESWRVKTLNENKNVDPRQAGAKLEDELEDIFDNALENLTSRLEKKKELNEVIGSLSIAFALWKITLASAGLASLLAKFGKMLIVSRTIDDTAGTIDLEAAPDLEKFSNFFDGVFETIATFATKPAVKFLVKMYMRGVGRTSEDVEKVQEQIDNIYKIIAVVIGLAVSGVELYKAAEQAGGIGNFIKELYSKAGITNAKAIQGTVDAFSTTVGTTADTFDAAEFITAMGVKVKDMYTSAPTP